MLPDSWGLYIVISLYQEAIGVSLSDLMFGEPEYSEDWMVEEQMGSLRLIMANCNILEEKKKHKAKEVKDMV